MAVASAVFSAVFRRKWLLLVGGAVGVVALLFGTGVLHLPGHGVEPTKAMSAEVVRSAVAVTVAKVTPRPVQRNVRVVGSLWGRDEIAITPEVEGRIVAIHHDVGDRVRPGAVLLEIDDTDFRLAANEARRALELELAKLGLKEMPPEKFEVKALPSVVRAVSMRDNAEAKLDRLKRLRFGAATQEERDQAETDLRVAHANYEQTLLDAQATLAAVRYRKAILESAEQRLKDTRVLVPEPSSGTGATGSSGPVEYAVAQRMASVGELLRQGGSSGMSVFRLVIDDPLKLQATVPERYLGEVKVGQSVAIEVEAYRDESFAGKVARVNPTVDRSNRTFQIEVEVPNTDRRLRAGSFAKGVVSTRVDPAAPTVPEEALVRFAGVVKLFVIRDDHAHEIQVQPGVRLDVPDAKGRTHVWVEVAGDLKPGDVVVTSGMSQLAEGTEVRVREAPPTK